MIHIDFADFDDMMKFARSLVGTVPAEKAPQPEMAQTIPAPVADITVPSMAPVTVPVTPAPAPTAPVQTVPTPAPAQVTAAPVTAVPTTTASYTLDDLARAAMVLMDAGRQNDLLGLLGQFGVDSLPNLPQQQYGAFATALRGMGAQI